MKVDLILLRSSIKSRLKSLDSDTRLVQVKFTPNALTLITMKKCGMCLLVQQDALCLNNTKRLLLVRSFLSPLHKMAGKPMCLHLPLIETSQQTIANQAVANRDLTSGWIIIANKVIEEMVVLKKSSMPFEEIANQLNFKHTTLMQEHQSFIKMGNFGRIKVHKVTPDSQIKDVFSIILGLLQSDPHLWLKQVRYQLRHHKIWVTSHIVQLWMHGPAVTICVHQIRRETSGMTILPICIIPRFSLK